MSLGCESSETAIDEVAECEIGFTVEFDLLRLVHEPANSAGGDAGEKFARVVGFGASRDVGGFVLGLKTIGDNGRGVSDEKTCLPIGDVTVEGGESGKKLRGGTVSRKSTGFAPSGFGYPSSGRFGGDGGGEGVEAAERKVGPGGVEDVSGTGKSWVRGIARSLPCDKGRRCNRSGLGCAIVESPVTLAVDEIGSGSTVGKNWFVSTINTG